MASLLSACFNINIIFEVNFVLSTSEHCILCVTAISFINCAEKNVSPLPDVSALVKRVDIIATAVFVQI